MALMLFSSEVDNYDEWKELFGLRSRRSEVDHEGASDLPLRR